MNENTEAPPAADGGHYAARPEAMRSIAGNVGALVMRATGALQAFERPAVDPDSFGSIARSVGSAEKALHDQEVTALSSVLKLLQGISSQVQQSADNYQLADAAVAERYTGRPMPAPSGPLTWPSAPSAALAALAAADAGPGTPHRAAAVAGYLAQAGFGQRGPLPAPAGSAADLMAWLADSPEHQAQLGVIAVYQGGARTLRDMPGGLCPGDLVCIAPGGDTAGPGVSVGVVGPEGGLYNHGLTSPDLRGIAEVHVYRPMITTDQENLA